MAQTSPAGQQARTPTEVRAQAVLSEDLCTWAERHRKDDRSWPWIAKKLSQLSNGQIDVTPQYLRQLYKQRAEQTAA
jgi:hypothetical protein